MAISDGLRVTRVDQAAPAVAIAYLLEPPGWTRLEPQSISGDPTPGLEARVHDPLWLLTRQWQLGEFHGQDLGSPVFVHVTSSTAGIRGYQAGDPSAAHAARAWRAGDMLDPVAEREPGSARGPGLTQRAEAGAQLLTELAPFGVDSAVAQMISDCPLQLSWDDPHDPAGAERLALFAGRLPDPEQVATRMALDTDTPSPCTVVRRATRPRPRPGRHRGLAPVVPPGHRAAARTRRRRLGATTGWSTGTPSTSPPLPVSACFAHRSSAGDGSSGMRWMTTRRRLACCLGPLRHRRPPPQPCSRLRYVSPGMPGEPLLAVRGRAGQLRRSAGPAA